jgi:hypothetical protein
MKSKIGLKCFILMLLCSCSVLTKTKKLQTGRVLMYGTQYPLAVQIDIYQKRKKISSTKSDSLGYFKFPKFKRHVDELTLVIPKNEMPDTIWNVNGHNYLLFKCKSSDTINTIIKNNIDTIFITSNCCELLIIEAPKPHREH